MKNSMVKIRHELHRPDLPAEDMGVTGRQVEKDLKRILEETSIVVDVGANAGQFTGEVFNIVLVRNIYSFERRFSVYRVGDFVEKTLTNHTDKESSFRSKW